MVRCTLYNRTQGCWHKTRQTPKSKVRGTEGFFSPICDMNHLDEIHVVLVRHRYQFCWLYSRLLQHNIDAIWESNGLFLCENLLNPLSVDLYHTNVQIPTPHTRSTERNTRFDLGFGIRSRDETMKLISTDRDSFLYPTSTGDIESQFPNSFSSP